MARPGGLLGAHVDVLSEGGVSPYLRRRIYADAVPVKDERTYFLHAVEAIDAIFRYACDGRQAFY